MKGSRNANPAIPFTRAQAVSHNAILPLKYYRDLAETVVGIKIGLWHVEEMNLKVCTVQLFKSELDGVRVEAMRLPGGYRMRREEGST